MKIHFSFIFPKGLCDVKIKKTEISFQENSLSVNTKFISTLRIVSVSLGNISLPKIA